MMGFRFANDKPLNILCLGAHCDDIEIGAGGTLLSIFEKYELESVKWVVFASNDIRKKEAIDSASQFLKNIEKTDIVVNSYRDGFLPFMAYEIKDFFESLKHDFIPNVIFTHFRNDRHQDHRLISDLTWNTWRNHQILEYEIPKYDGDLGNPNFYVHLDEKILEKKNKILMDAYNSQKTKHWFDEDTFSALPRLRGMESATKYAEAFYARKFLLE